MTLQKMIVIIEFNLCIDSMLTKRTHHSIWKALSNGFDKELENINTDE